MADQNKHPRDTYITVYGRKPVLEVLQMPDIQVEKIFLLKGAKAPILVDIEKLCKQKNITIERTTAEQVSRISKNPKQDQGIAADVVVPQMNDFEQFISNLNAQKKLGIIALDGVTTPANVGLIIRSCTGLGLDGLLIPRKGSSSLNPLVVKASAGVIFKSTLLKCEKLGEALRLAKQHGCTIYGLSGTGKESLYQANLAPRSIFVLGNESEGVSPEIAKLVDVWLHIPMFNSVESLNVACAGAIVAAEWGRKL